MPDDYIQQLEQQVALWKHKSRFNEKNAINRYKKLEAIRKLLNE